MHEGCEGVRGRGDCRAPTAGWERRRDMLVLGFLWRCRGATKTRSAAASRICHRKCVCREEKPARSPSCGSPTSQSTSTLQSRGATR